MSIPVIDIFSGPGGLGEGFAGLDDGNVFKILVSAEMHPAAHQTLRLRSYFRLLKASSLGTGAYYDFCSGIGKTPWNSDESKALWDEAGEEALNITLGTPDGDTRLDEAIEARLCPDVNCVLIGGPPCQAYSLAGRSRNRAKKEYKPESDHRHFLYREYLRVLQKARPAAFVMENVKGILSSRVGGRQIFHDILTDLVNPYAALGLGGGGQVSYSICSLTKATIFSEGMDVESIDPSDFVIRSEEHGIPQARHRVILLGVRSDISSKPGLLLASGGRISVNDAIGDLPKLRSRLSKQEDSCERWAEVVRSHCRDLVSHADSSRMEQLATVLLDAADRIPANGILGGARMPKGNGTRSAPSEWLPVLSDPQLEVVLNHESRCHMSEDLRRYLFASAFARATKRSPKGSDDFSLPGLAPRHANWKTGKFSDRFRVQLADKPSTTITSHISKDGHYFIHHDPAQCRSLTVREAARLQTFPDNYFFEGNRTEQFHQVGNAVPPLLARQIAQLVARLIKSPKGIGE